MGLIRKSLAVGTAGVVKGSSKKQRVAKATMKHAAAGARASESAASAAAHLNATVNAGARLAIEKAAREEDFRYDTDPTYRQWVDARNEAEATARRLDRERLEAAGVAAVQAKACKKAKRRVGSLPVNPPPAGHRWCFLPPPNWPPAPEGWTAVAGWQPDPSWGPPPTSWLVWTVEPVPTTLELS